MYRSLGGEGRGGEGRGGEGRGKRVHVHVWKINLAVLVSACPILLHSRSLHVT